MVRFSALGDVAMTIPALYSACRCNPSVEFVMVTRRPFAGIFVNPPANLRVLGVDLKDEYKGPKGMMKLAASLGADTVVDLHDVLRSWMLSAFSCVRGARVVRFDKARAAKKQLIAKGAGGARPVSPTIGRYFDALGHAGLRMEPRFDGLFAEKSADSSLFSRLTQEKPKGWKWIGIAPFAAHAGKIYPPEQMHEVVRALGSRPDTKVFLFGGGQTETAVLAQWAGEAGNIVCVAGSGIGFAGELALMSQLDLMVSMDSGNMHLAAVAGAPLLGIWGATHPAAGFLAWRMDESDCLQIPMDCRPCSVFGNKPCRLGDCPCLKNISPAMVIDAVNRKLNEQTA